VYSTDDYRHEQFLALVLTELRLRHVPFDRRAFEEFMEALKPLVCEGDSPAAWADAFLEAHPAAGEPSAV
jgi:hypothetical protein